MNSIGLQCRENRHEGRFLLGGVDAPLSVLPTLWSGSAGVGERTRTPFLNLEAFAIRIPWISKNAVTFGIPHPIPLFLLALILLASSGCGSNTPNKSESVDGVLSSDAAELMRQAAASRDWEAADRYAKEAMIENPGDPDLMTMAAAIAAFSGRKEQGAELLVEVAKLTDFDPSRVDAAVSGLIEVGEVYNAISLLEESLKENPDQWQHRRTLVGFWNEVQRTEQIPSHLAKLIQSRKFDVKLLMSTTDTATRRLSRKTFDRLIERNPNDHRVRLAEAFLLLYQRDGSGAAEVLEDILQYHQGFAPAYAMYGQALVNCERWEELPDWAAEAPRGSKDYADYWLTIGDVCSRQERAAQAARAYWEATKRDPGSHKAWERLAQSLRIVEEQEESGSAGVSEQTFDQIHDHANRLLELREAFNDFAGHGKESQSSATRLADVLFDLGRTWEAEAWSALALGMEKDASVPLDGLRGDVLDRLRRDQDWYSTEVPARRIDLSFLPEPAIRKTDSIVDDSEKLVIPTVPTHNHVRLSLRSDAWGLEGVGADNDPSDPKVAPLIRSTGVGGGSVDYDLDGLPDLVVMNAGGTMLQLDSKPNELMRNLGGKFASVGVEAAIATTEYGQGVAIGDLNEDGFPDLFFAALGANRLLRNNGDGTFTDCTRECLKQNSGTEQRWTTSAAFFDVDGDACSDLITANYCQISPSLVDPCPDENGIPGPCHPLTFPPDTDQFFRNGQDGVLSDVTERWAESIVPGLGLGILAGALDGAAGGVFVANDMTRNAYYARRAKGPVELRDSAGARGVSVDGRSLVQASMGIAASDLDLDGDLDLYVTGFGREYNVYYEQVAPGVWKDSTARLDLVEPTLALVAFGSQAIDLDNDGLDELLVTNGHIGEFNYPEAPPYAQEFQAFRRGGNGRFELLDSNRWDEYFTRSHVGRALWKMDVNVDGRPDAVVTHAREQLALLINESEDPNGCIGFQLVGRDVSRDAVGAVIRFEVDGKPRTLWRVSGDGYFCTNESTLIAGLGSASEITDVTVTWHDGTVQQCDTLRANGLYLIIQDLDPYLLHGYKH